MREAVMEIKNLYGLHMRPAMMFAELASGFDSEIRVVFDNMDVDGKSIAEVMTLGLPAGSKIKVIAKGCDSQKALDAIAELVEKRLFDEAEAS